ncbi:MAG: hypothetical protein P1T08_17235 [Acidimicrobiia bacterium]|nr:hypothetical protein [Acidimicrobiia bacterium]
MIEPLTSPPTKPSPRAAGMAAAGGAGLMLTSPGFDSEVLTFLMAAAGAPLLGWALLGLLSIHRDGRGPALSAGFWIAESGVLSLTVGYLMAAIEAGAGIDVETGSASVAGLVPATLIFLAFFVLLPVGLGLFGVAAWRTGALGPWKRLLPSLTAAVGVLAPQLLLVGFIALGFGMWDQGRRLDSVAG